jgi:hypothetical protein
LSGLPAISLSAASRKDRRAAKQSFAAQRGGTAAEKFPAARKSIAFPLGEYIPLGE